MEVECRSDDGVWRDLAGPWEALHEQSESATIFNSPVYARLWWHHWGTPGSLQMWTVWDGGQLLGVAPLYETVDGDGEPLLRLVGGVELSDYLDIVVAPRREEDVVAALLEAWADAPCRCPLDLHAIRHASPTREAFLRLAPEAGFHVMVEEEEVCPVITLPETWEDYLHGIESKQRHELRRKMRKAGQEALVTHYQVTEPLIREEMEHFFSLHGRSSPAKAAFMTPPMQAFFRDLARTFAERGWLELSFLLVNGKRAAATVNFLFRDEVLLYNSGYDAAVDEALSPGWLLLCYGIEAAIAQGYRRYDFLRANWIRMAKRRKGLQKRIEHAIEIGVGMALLVGLGLRFVAGTDAAEAFGYAVAVGGSAIALWLSRPLFGWLWDKGRSSDIRGGGTGGLVALLAFLLTAAWSRYMREMSPLESLEAAAVVSLLIVALWLARPFFLWVGKSVAELLKGLANRISLKWNASAQPTRTPPVTPSGPVKRKLLRLTPAEFEELCARIGREWGYEARTVGESGDGGIDVEMWRDGEYIVAQCKRYKNTVPISHVRDFYGAMMHVGAARGYFFTTSRFSDGAYEFVEGKGIELIDGRYIETILARMS